MDTEICDMFKVMLDEIADKQIENSERTICNKVLRVNINQVKQCLIESQKILKNREMFHKEDFKAWQGCVALLAQRLDDIFTKEMFNRIRKDGIL